MPPTAGCERVYPEFPPGYRYGDWVPTRQSGASAKRLAPCLAIAAIVVAGCSLGTPTPASDVTTDGATLNGTVHSNQSGEVLYWFEYGTTKGYGTKTPDRALEFPEDHSASDDPVAVAEPISGLEPDTTYHYRICTSPGAQAGSRGCVNQDQSFTTDHRVPLAAATSPSATRSPRSAIPSATRSDSSPTWTGPAKRTSCTTSARTGRPVAASTVPS